MVSVSYREEIKNILGLISTTIDNGLTAADILVMYEGGPENLKPLFLVNDMDVVITVGPVRTRESGDMRRIQDKPIRQDVYVPVHVCSMDKTGVTATLMLDKMKFEFFYLVGVLAQRPTATIIVESGDARNMIAGGYDPIWMDSYTFHYRPLETT